MTDLPEGMKRTWIEVEDDRRGSNSTIQMSEEAPKAIKLVPEVSLIPSEFVEACIRIGIPNYLVLLLLLFILIILLLLLL